MLSEYAKDNRTEEQVKKDFDYGKANEKIVFEHLGCNKYWVNGSDEFGETESYKPDCFILHRGLWYPAEIKFTEYEISGIQLKHNQATILARINGLYIQSTPTRFCITRAVDIIKMPLIEYSYCNKPCYIIRDPNWIKWNSKIDYVTK
jgi:hypothetical protein